MAYDKNILGWMLETELHVLEKWGSSVPKNGHIVEIGSMFGRSAVCWAMSADPSVRVTCIDIFYEDYQSSHNISQEDCLQNCYPLSNTKYNLKEAFVANTRKFKNVHMIQGSSPYGIAYDQASIDLFFLDASHSNPNDWDNLNFFLPFVKDDGLICGHDYANAYPDVKANVSRLEKLLNRPATFYENTLLWSIQK